MTWITTAGRSGGARRPGGDRPRPVVPIRLPLPSPALKPGPDAFDNPSMGVDVDGHLDDSPRTVIAGPPVLPPGRPIDLPGRGTTWVHDHPGPDGAPTLLLLHGWTVTGGLNWFASFPALSTRYRVVTIDHRGHGRGVRAPRFRLSDCADDAVALADVLGIDSFIPVGYSMGGPIAQLLWHRHPERVQGLVLCATSRNFRGSPVERAMFAGLGGLSLAARMTPSDWHRGINERILLRKYDDSEIGRWARQEVARNDARAVIEAGHALGRFSSHDWIGDVDVPTAVVVTERDSVVSPHRQHKLAESIDGATVHPVAGDHAVCVMQPNRFVPALMGACHSVERRVRGSASGSAA